MLLTHTTTIMKSAAKAWSLYENSMENTICLYPNSTCSWQPIRSYNPEMAWKLLL